MSAFETLRFAAAADHVALVTLSRPEAANALSTRLAEEIKHCFNGLEKEWRAVVLTGAGEKAFCAGADLKERKGMDEAAWEAQHAALRGARDAVLACPVPVIAAVNGAAYGGGLELALACDFMYASETAKFALPEATLGIMPGMGGTQALPRAVGARPAAELLFTGRAFTAAEAHATGLANRLCAPESLLEEALATARAIAANAPLSMRAIKRAMREGEGKPLADALAAELAAYRPLLATQDREEGINAFNDKRKAVFTGS